MATAGLDVTTKAVGAVTRPISEEAKKEFDAISKNPALGISNGLIKWGAVTFGVGVVFYFLHTSAEQAATGFDADIDRRLGIHSPPRPTPPSTPPAVPPPAAAPPVGLTQFNAVASAISSIDPVDAATAYGQLQSAFQLAVNLWYTLTAAKAVLIPATDTTGGGDRGTVIVPAHTEMVPQQSPPGDSLNAVQSVMVQIWRAMNALNGVPSPPVVGYENLGGEGTLISFNQMMDLAEGTPYVPATSTDWTDAQNSIGQNSGGADLSAKSSMNSLADALGFTEPFNLSAPPASGPWGVIAGAVTLLESVPAGALHDGENVGNAAVASVDAIGAGIQATYNDVANFSGDVGSGLAMVARGIINFPELIWDGLGFSGAWAVEMFTGYLFWPMIGLGLGMLALGITVRFGYSYVWPKVKPRAQLVLDARSAKFWNGIDRRIGYRQAIAEVESQHAQDVAIKKAVATTTVVPPAVKAPAPSDTLPNIPGGAASGEMAGGGESGSPIPASTPPADPPIPGGATTEETQEFLGETRTRAPMPQELRTMAEESERNRRKTLPANEGEPSTEELLAVANDFPVET